MSVDEHFVAKKKMQSQFDFKKARVVESTTGRDPYVVFYVWDVQKNGLVRKRKIAPANFKSYASKLAHCKDLCKKINLLLNEGFHIDRTRVPAHKKTDEETIVYPSMDEMIPRYINYCTNISRNSERELNDKLNSIQKFRDWLDDRRTPVTYASEITERMAQDYFDYLIEVKGNGPKTYNNNLGRLKNFLNIAIKRKWMEGKNPFDAVDRQRTEYGEKNTAYTEKQLREIIPYVQEQDPYLYKFICFIYYAMMRPSEIKRLKVKNIDIEKRIIRIESEQSKVKRFDILPIAEELYKVILTMELENYDLEDYLFTAREHPAKRKMSHSWTTEHFKKVKDKFNLSTNHSIYAFKHTAVCRWYEKEKDIVRIQKMCRHSTIEMTARYLKSLGLMTDQYKIETIPNL